MVDKVHMVESSGGLSHVPMLHNTDGMQVSSLSMCICVSTKCMH